MCSELSEVVYREMMVSYQNGPYQPDKYLQWSLILLTDNEEDLDYIQHEQREYKWCQVYRGSSYTPSQCASGFSSTFKWPLLLTDKRGGGFKPIDIFFQVTPLGPKKNLVPRPQKCFRTKIVFYLCEKAQQIWQP